MPVLPLRRAFAAGLCVSAMLANLVDGAWLSAAIMAGFAVATGLCVAHGLRDGRRS